MKGKLFFVFTLLSLKISAQDLPMQIKLGVQQKYYSKEIPSPQTVIYSDKKGFLEISYAAHKYFLERIDTDLQVEKTVQFDVPKNRTQATLTPGIFQGYYYSGSLLENGKLCIFWTYYDKKGSQFVLYYFLFNPSTCEQEQGMTELLRSKSAYLWFPADIKDQYDFFKFATSPDHKLFSIIYQTDLPGNSNSACEMVVVMDSTINKVWNTKYVYPFITGHFDVRQTSIDNDGNVIFSGMEVLKTIPVFGSSEIFPLRAEVPYTHYHGNYHLTVLKKDGTIQDMIVDLQDKDKKICDLTFVQKDNSVIVLGFWLNEDSYDQKSDHNSFGITDINSNGSFFLKYDLSDLYNPTVKTFNHSKDLIAENNAPSTVEVDLKDAPVNTSFVANLVPQHILFMANGDIVLLAEQLNLCAFSVVNLHFSGMIAIFRFNRSGELKNTSFVPKSKFIGYNPTFDFVQNYTYFIKDDLIYILYSKSKNDNNNKAEPKESNISVAQISEYGETKISVLQYFKDEDYYMLDQGWSFPDPQNSRVLLFGIEDKGSKYRALLVTY